MAWTYATDLLNWSTHACYILIPKLRCRSLCHLDTQQAVGTRQLRRDRELPGSVLSRLAQCVRVRNGHPEIRLHDGIRMDHFVPSARHPLHALLRRHDPLGRLRVPEHGQEPYLRLHLHLLQHLLPPEVVRQSVRCHHLLQFLFELPDPSPGQMVWRKRRVQDCKLCMDTCLNSFIANLLLLYLQHQRITRSFAKS